MSVPLIQFIMRIVSLRPVSPSNISHVVRYPYYRESECLVEKFHSLVDVESYVADT